MKLSWISVLVVVSLLIAVSGGAARAQDADTANLLPVGAQAPDFAALTWSGGTAHLSDYRGKIVVLDFWAPWCGPCNAAMPRLQAIHSEYQDDGVTVLALCIDDTPDHANAWVAAHKEDTLTFLMDPAGKDADSLGPSNDIPTQYGIKVIPTTYILDGSGHVVAHGVDMSKEDLAAIVERLGARTAREKASAGDVADQIKQVDAENAAEEAAEHHRSAKTHAAIAHHAKLKSKKSSPKTPNIS